ncbi:Ig-like domain-containing protein [Arthrobacter sp. HY1533]|uniref:Ig-like domain-containing protein n=1 Tax=Arthrobacter sp. HY1533 TaxID=2970919 RepID=UPI0022B9EEF2|nr:Ig-like domain-containing protein [Arthrobacter sp. HY1533]
MGLLGVVAAVVAGAVVYPGFATADVDLNDGSVWVTNRSLNMVAHLNSESKELDGGFAASSDNFDVLQNAATVFMDNDAGTLMNQVDVPAMALTQDTVMSGAKSLSLGSSLVAISDPVAGKVWVMQPGAVSSFSDKTTAATLSAMPNAKAVVAQSGKGEVSTVLALNPETAQLTTLSVEPGGHVVDKKTDVVAGLPDSADLELSSVGGNAVVLDPATGTLFLPGNKKVALAGGKGARLQHPSVDADAVAIETSAGMVLQPLDGQAATEVPMKTAGQPIAPIQQGGCIHAAWGGSNQYLFHCAGQDPAFQTIPGASAASRLAFRQNRDVVVLNDTAGGNVWLVNDNLRLVNNWDDLKADMNKSDNPEKDSADPNVVNTLPDRTKPNRPPLAVLDSFGVRPGATSILPVLYNDSDPDGDVLTVRGAEGKLQSGEIETIYGGTGLQLVVPASAPAISETFVYTANDGRGGVGQANVTVRVVPQDENSAPVSLRPTTMVVAQGASISQNVLTDMIDPDGDDIFLVKAVAGDDSAEVKFTPDGQLSYLDNGKDSGPKKVTVTVSDNRTTVEKTIAVSVKPAGSVPPVANADYVRVVSGQSAVVAPLKNDQDPAGGELRLASVDKATAGTVSTISDNNTFSYTATTVGSVYLTYQVTNGPQSSTGLIRIEVVAPDEALAPVAVKDIAMLPTGGTALVDVLENDSDPAGGILVVRSVDVPEDSGLSVTVLDHQIVKVTDLRSNGQPVAIKYSISNGHASSSGSISVVQIPAPATVQPPVAKEDSAVVRAGDVVRIPVLANDLDPNGEVLKNPEITQAPEESMGKLWVDENSLRFLAGPTPGTVSAVYKISNSSGQSSSAQVSITVVPEDPERNLPPAPKNIHGRVIAGSSTRVQVPLDGIDPDGDSVQLVGIDLAPALGTATVGNGFISYTAAGNSAGTDSFSYKVRDRLGAEAVGQVRIGIAPAEESNHPPKTQDDFITIRPGRHVALDLLLNDADPDGDPLAVVADGFAGPEEMQPSVTKQGRVLVTSPQEAGVATLSYTVADPSGATARGTLRMSVTPDAPLRAPIARDDTVTVQEALGKNTVDVPVLKNDEDPDGVAEDMQVSLARPTENASVGADGTLRVQLAATAQMIPYTVTDQDMLEATAVVWVPGTGQQYPVLKKSDPIKVQAGNSATLDLNDYVKVRDGRTPRITQADKIKLIGAAPAGAVNSAGTGIKYAANTDFFGPGSITFEVTDGTGPDDMEGLKSTLTVMTEVAPSPAKNLAPTLNGTQLDVAQLGSATLDLSKLASDPEGDPLAFKLAGTRPAGVSASVDGARLKVEASKDAALGKTLELGIEASDGSNGPVAATVTLRVTSSTKPLAVANEDRVPDAHAGRLETVDVLSNDTNPFPDTPLKLVDVKLITGAAGTAVAKNGGSVAVTAPENFTGNVVVGYTVEDKTADRNRWVDGKITLNVKGRPAAPAAPRIQEVKSKQVMLQWTTPADNGATLTGYTVSKSDGGTQECATNTCLITGLKNGAAYTFTVKATNSVGSSEFSRASAKATPDAAPDTPAAPVVKRGDQQLDVSWETPTGEYSAVKSFNVEISPAPAGQNPQQSVTAGNKLSWTGLSNGTEYAFRVQAVNNAPEPSAWSRYSALGKPAGKPFTPGAPTLTVLDTLGSQNQVQLDWVQPDLNGGGLKNYTVTRFLDGAVQGTLAAGGTSTVVSLPNGAGNYTFAVSVSTEVDISDLGAQSAPRRSVSKPGPVTGLRITEANTGAAGRQILVDFTPPQGAALGGSAPGELSYTATVNGGIGGTSIITPGMYLPATNGAGTTVTIVVSSSATTEKSGPATSNAATPYGVPGTPGIAAGGSGTGDTRAYYSWDAPGANTDSVAVRINDGGGFGAEIPAKNGSGSVDLGGPNRSRDIQIQSRNSRGDWGPIATATARSGPPRPTTARTDPGIGGNSCTVPLVGGDFHWRPSANPEECNKVQNTSADPGGQWLSYGDGEVQIDSCANVWPSSGNWYRISSGRLTGYYVLPSSVNVTGPPPC